MNDLLLKIRDRLEAAPLAENLTRLFCETLRWGAPQGMVPRPLQVGAPVASTITVIPVAQLSGLPVYRVDWLEDRAPTVTARRAVQKALAPVHAEHLLCYVTRDKRQVAFTWARKRADAKTELRTLPYEVGTPARTTIERLGELAFSLEELGLFGQPPITAITDKLNSAFSVEAVTKQFYQEIAAWYFWARACKDVTLPKDVKTEEDRALFIIRLLTRLIFCWFLLKKRDPRSGAHLLPYTLFDETDIRRMLKDPSPSASTYYPAILQNFFFATLNTEMDKPGEPPTRRFIEEGDGQRSDDHMIHTVWRNAKLLNDPEGFAQLLRKIPFMNGGLFECLDDRVPKGNSNYTEEVRIDGFSNDPKKHPKLPNYLFFGADQTADLSGAYGDSDHRRETVRPLLSILSSYNFTLTENTPLEQEVALDPELLGHVFENLLAAYNPETGTVARKATGSFYTPRVVVDWMADQALILYLDQALGRRTNSDNNERVSDTRLKTLLAWDETSPEFSKQETDALIDAIDRLKVLDPACGSGAFPMGMLQKLVHVLRKLDPDNTSWHNRQEVALKTFESSTMREEARRAIERAFARDNDDYGRKLYLIEKCLYGVDIQPIACQLAKLRFFIALIVDQEIDPSEPNYGILPLPNLETKIVAANTLLGLARGSLLLKGDRVRSLEKELQQVRHDYFTARRYKDKKALRAKDKELCEALAKALEESGDFTPFDTQRIARWNPYNTQIAASFFDPAWMFGLATDHYDGDGPFDIAIGNPPYVRQEQLRSVTVIGSDGKPKPLKDVLKDLYECYTGTADLYVYFFERALQLLNVGGVLSYITSNKYMRAAYGEKLRTYLAYATQPQVVLDFGDAPVFTSIAYPCIVVTEKTRHVEKGQLVSADKLKHYLAAPERALCVYTWNSADDVSDFPAIFEDKAQSLVHRDLKPDSWLLESPVNLRLLERLRRTGTPLGKYVQDRFYRGILTGLNEAFVVDRGTRDRLIAEHASSADVLKPFLRGRDVKRWRCEFQDLWLIFTRRGCDIKKYPAIYEHLKQFKKQLMPGVPGGRKPGNYEWYEIQDAVDYWQEFEQPKVIFGRFMNKPTYAFDDTGLYHNDALYFASRITPFAVAVLNSPVNWWFLTQTSTDLQNGYLQALRQYQEVIPIPSATPNQQRWCERLTAALIWLHRPGPTKKKPDNAPFALMQAYFEQWLNGLVYELFFPEELRGRKLKLFEETAHLDLPDLSKLSEGRKLARLTELFEQTYDSNANLREMLFSLRSLDVVRIIEESTDRTAVSSQGEI